MRPAPVPKAHPKIHAQQLRSLIGRTLLPMSEWVASSNSLLLTCRRAHALAAPADSHVLTCAVRQDSVSHGVAMAA